MREISAGIIIYRKTKDGVKFLILYHGRGYWNFPKGKISTRIAFAPASQSRLPAGDLPKGENTLEREAPPRRVHAPTRIRETSFQAAVREIKEEVGLKLRDLKFAKDFKAYEKFVFWHRLGNRNVKVFKIVIFYLAETRQSQIRISKEHNGFGWFTYKEALKILGKYKDSQRVLTQANEFLKRRKI
jgi:8-oxo-dGTP pyrophosphatase MutT (NUDIX family)